MSKDKDDILVGAQLSPKLTFSKGLLKIDVLPVIIDFRRLLLSEHETKTYTPVIPDIANRDLLHAVVALYANSLEEMTPNILYQTVCEKWSRTIILLTDNSDASNEENDVNQNSSTKLLNEKDIYTENQQAERDAIFDEVYSDQEDIDDEEEEEEHIHRETIDKCDYDFTTGIKSFLAAVRRRKSMPICKNAVEKRIVGAVTLKKTYCKYEKIMHLTVMSIRRLYRNMGIGSYLVCQLKDPAVAGLYDALVVHADSKAVQFFDKHGFNDDIILNSKWSEIADQFTDCTLMTYLPPYAGQSIIDEDTPSLDATLIKRDLVKWRQKALEAYQAEAICVGRLQQELTNSRAIIQSQREQIVSLKLLINEKSTVDKKLNYTERLNLMDSEDEEDDQNRSEEVKSRKASDEMQFLINNDQEVYDHCKDTIDFYQVSQMFLSLIRKDKKINYEIRSIIKAILPEEIMHSYQELTGTFGESPMITKMYYLPTKESRISNILKTGFLQEDFINAEFGNGIYLSKSPKRSIGVNSKGKIILAEVALGNVETVLTRNKSRKSPSIGFHSILVQGRQSHSEYQRYQKSDQEFVIFDPQQLIPLYSLEYAIKS